MSLQQEPQVRAYSISLSKHLEAEPWQHLPQMVSLGTVFAQRFRSSLFKCMRVDSEYTG